MHSLPRRIWIGAVVVPLLLAGAGVLLLGNPARVRSVVMQEVAPGQLLLVVRADEIVLAGTAADDDERRELVDAVRFRAGRHRITDVITPNAGARVPIPLNQAGALVGVVLDNGVQHFAGVVHGGRLSAAARVPDPARAGMLSDGLRSVAGELRVDEDFTIGSSGGAGDLDLRALNDTVNRVVAEHGGIRFQPGTTSWDGAGPALVERVGRILLVAPRSTVSVVSHAADPQLAKIRAGMVRDVLVGQGVSPALVETTINPDPAAESHVDVGVR